LVRQEVTMAEAAASQEVDPSTILRIRTVAKAGGEGGVQARRCHLEKAVELGAANAEVVRFAAGDPHITSAQPQTGLGPAVTNADFHVTVELTLFRSVRTGQTRHETYTSRTITSLAAQLHSRQRCR